MPPSPNIKAMLQEASTAHRTGDVVQAERLYTQILDVEPDQPDALNLLGAIHGARGDHDTAIALIQRAVGQRPNFASAHYNLGLMHHQRSDYAEAAEAYGRAIAQNPHHADAMRDLATVSTELGRHDDALAYYTQAITSAPDNAKTMFMRSLHMLSCGDLKAGFEHYDSRFAVLDKARAAFRPEPPPYWAGESLYNKRLLLWTEQGLGEELLSVGLIQRLPHLRTTSVAVECSQRLVPVLRRSCPEYEIFSWNDHEIVAKRQASSQKAFDVQCPALNLAQYVELDGAPAASPDAFITPDPLALDRLRQKYAALANGRKVVGVSWHSAVSERGKKKSFPLAALAPILEEDNMFLVSLQYGDHSDEIAQVQNDLGTQLYVDPEVEQLGELDPVFAQIAAMDLIVTCSNSVAHMGGAVGVPTWVILPRGTGAPWFWFLERGDSPWYASVRLFRQPTATIGKPEWWDTPIRAVAKTLAVHASA